MENNRFGHPMPSSRTEISTDDIALALHSALHAYHAGAEHDAAMTGNPGFFQRSPGSGPVKIST